MLRNAPVASSGAATRFTSRITLLVCSISRVCLFHTPRSFSSSLLRQSLVRLLNCAIIGSIGVTRGGNICCAVGRRQPLTSKTKEFLEEVAHGSVRRAQLERFSQIRHDPALGRRHHIQRGEVLIDVDAVVLGPLLTQDCYF